MSHHGADKEHWGEQVITIVLGNCGSVVARPPPIIKDEMQVMFIRLFVSQMVTENLVED